MSKEFIIRRADGSERRVSGYKSAAPSSDAKRYSAKKYGEKELPPRVDLRSYMTAVEDQSATSSCVANAVAGAYEYLVKRHLEDDSYDVSRMFIYYNARELDGNEIEDEGCYISHAIDSLKKYGACSEETVPFKKAAVNKKPSDEAYEEAANFLVEDVVSIPVNLYDWRHALAEGHPIIFGITLFNSFDSHKKKGLVPMPSQKEASRDSHSGHAMLCVGYSDKDRLFIVRNSWGEDWGDNGYCYIPYDYLMNTEFNDGDAWVIRQLDNFDPDQSTWHDDEESLLGDYDSELANMDEDDYQKMLDDMGDYPLDYRIAQLFLYGAECDSYLSDEETEEIASYLETTFEKMGSESNPARVLKNAAKDSDNEELAWETIELFAEYFSNPMLARIVNDIQEVIGVDAVSDDEDDFINELIETWQITENEMEKLTDEEGYLYINEFYIRSKKQPAFLKGLEELCAKHAVDEDYEYEDSVDEEDKEYLYLDGFCILPKDAEKFLDGFEALCAKMALEEEYDYSAGSEAIEGDDDGDDDGSTQLTGFYIRLKKADPFLKELDKLCTKYAIAEDYDYDSYPDEEDKEVLYIEDFYIMTDDPDTFLEKLDALCSKMAIEDDYDYEVGDFGGEEEEK